MLSEAEISAILLENTRLKDLVQKQELSLVLKDKTLAQQEETIAQKEAEIALYKRMIFGQKRERFVDSPQGQLELPFVIDEQEVIQAVEEIQKEKEQQKGSSTAKSTKKHPGRAPLPKHLEVKEVVLEPGGDLSNMVYVGDEVSEVLDYQPAKYYILRTIRRKYAPKSGEGSFLIAPLAEQFLDKSSAGAGLVSQILIDKYVDHLPFCRQLQRFRREGIVIPEATLHHWAYRGIQKIEILYDYLWERQQRCGYLQVDETTLKVLQTDPKDQRKPNATHLGYYWVYYDPVGKIPIFKYEKGRGGQYPTAQLKDFRGFLQTDGYGGYNELAKREDITHLICWAHARRGFDKALENDAPRAQIALKWIQELYHIEREIKDLTPQEKKEVRLEKSLPLLNAFFKWVAQQKKQVLPKSQIGKAIDYCLKHYDSLMHYLYHGELAIDNNAVENCIRPIALGRKNYLFAKNHESAQRAAILYTFMAICKQHQVNPYDWLTYVLAQIDQTKITQLNDLLPQNFKKQDGVA